MTYEALLEALENGAFSKPFHRLYPHHTNVVERYCKAVKAFGEVYGTSGELRLFSAPGRTEVGGNHTDHQHGRVLTGSVDLDIIAVVRAAPDNRVRLLSEGYEPMEVDLNHLSVRESETGRTEALVRGCANFTVKAGFPIGGFDAYITSDVMRGSGLSSSAALEVLFCTIFNGLYANHQMDRVRIAKIGQKAEREYFGKPCGLLDQMACSQGGFTAIDFKDPSAPVVEQVDFDLAAHGYELCVVDTHGDHADLTRDYADITVECREVSRFFDKDFLRDVDEQAFETHIDAIRKACGDRAVLRAFHFFRENERALQEKLALQQDDFPRFLALVNASGNSSFKYLQNVYSTCNIKSQGLSLALALTEEFLNNDGACRVHGGGFAGTIQVFIPSARLKEYQKMIDGVFGEGSCCVLSIRPVGGCEILAEA